MKLLNDLILKNKSHSYSVSISFQNMFLNRLNLKYNNLYQKISIKHHDYKSLTIGFEKDFDFTILEKAYRETQIEFEIHIKREITKKNISIPLEHQNFKKWHVSTIGQDFEQASIAAKFIPSNHLSHQNIVRYENIQDTFVNTLYNIDERWSRISLSLSNKIYFQTHKHKNKIIKTLNLQIIHFARQTRNFENFKKLFSNVYPKVELEIIKDIYNYCNDISKITASVLTDKTTSLTPQLSSGVVYSVDISKMGAYGHMMTMKYIHQMKNPREVLKQSRLAFWESDQHLTNLYRDIEKSFQFGKETRYVKKSSYVSGDDALFVFSTPMSSLRRQKAKLEKSNNKTAVENINHIMSETQDNINNYRESGFDNFILRVSSHETPDRFRISSVKPRYLKTKKTLTSQTILRYIEKAENFEKYLRNYLINNSKIDIKDMKNLTIGIETSPIDTQNLQHRVVIRNKSNLDGKNLEDIVNELYEKYIQQLDDINFNYLPPIISIF